MTNVKISVQNLSVFYGSKKAINNISVDIHANKVTAFIGPSGCGKSTVLRCCNRMNDTVSGARVEGVVSINGANIYDPSIDPIALRSKVGMVFQKPNPFPKSVYDNVAYGPRIHGMTRSKEELDAHVRDCLTKAGLWDEVKDNLGQIAGSLSGGQQQRLCIARAIAVKPEVLLMDEPCSALDPIATDKVENLISELKKNYTIVIVTHSMAQAKRLSDYTVFFHLGDIVETGETQDLFNNPREQKTADYLAGRYG